MALGRGEDFCDVRRPGVGQLRGRAEEALRRVAGGEDDVGLGRRAGLVADGVLAAAVDGDDVADDGDDPIDRRAKLVVATARGREVFAIAHELIDEIQADLEAQLGTEKVAQLCALLIELSETLDAQP